MHTVKLNNGVEMPLIGMGTYPLNGFKLAWLVRRAVAVGYRSFDAAAAYGNAKWLGRGIRFCGKPRSELFITTKLSNSRQRQGGVEAAFQTSLQRLGLGYVDLYLVHWPVPDFYIPSWKKMEGLYSRGLVRAIGVCNFHQHHLEELLRHAEIVPAVNQVELHPLLSQPQLVAYCKSQGIQVQAYSPLARMHPRLIGNEVLKAIAQQHRKSIPQVILRWNLQRGIPTTPKASRAVRLRENHDILDFELSSEQMDRINSLNEDFRVRFDPDNCDFDKL